MKTAKMESLETALGIVVIATVLVAIVSLARIPFLGFASGMLVHTMGPPLLLWFWRRRHDASETKIAAVLVATLLTYGVNGIIGTGSLDVNSLLMLAAVLISIFALPTLAAIGVTVFASLVILWSELQVGMHPMTALISYAAWAVIVAAIGAAFRLYDQRLNQALESARSKGRSLQGANEEMGRLSTHQSAVLRAMDRAGLGLATFNLRTGQLLEHNHSFVACLDGNRQDLPTSWIAFEQRIHPINLWQSDDETDDEPRYMRYQMVDDSSKSLVFASHDFESVDNGVERLVLVRSASKAIQSQIALQTSAAKLDLAIRSRQLYVYEYHIADDNVLMPTELQRLLGLSTKDGQRISLAAILAIMPRAHGIELQKLLGQLSATHIQRFENREFRFIAADGQLIWLALSGELSHSPTTGGRRLIIGTADNITRRKNLELSLIENREAASAAYLAKRQLLMTFGLEVRLLVNKMVGLLQRIRAQGGADGVTRDVRLALKVNENISDLIERMVDITSDPSGASKPVSGLFYLADVLEVVHQILSFEADQRGARIHFNVADDVPTRLSGDYRKLTQILLNLSGNAVTHGGGRDISIKVARVEHNRTDQTSDGKWCSLRFEVNDPSWHQSYDAPGEIYELDMDAGPTRSRKTQGAHLEVSRTLAKHLGGNLHIKDLAGDGVEFWVVLPFELPTSGNKIDQAGGSSKTLPQNADNQDSFEAFYQQSRMLVVDDDHLSLLALTRSLGLLGADVNTSQDGLAAVGDYQANHGQYDVILMDTNMPVMDGLGATAKIRSLGYPTQPVIIAMTTTACSEESAQALAAGADGCLTKPVDVGDIFDIVQGTLAQRRLGQLSG